MIKKKKVSKEAMEVKTSIDIPWKYQRSHGETGGKEFCCFLYILFPKNPAGLMSFPGLASL
jgi:hypothetical protein